MKKICKHCKKEFEATHNAFKYCSPSCKRGENTYKISLREKENPELYADRMCKYLHYVEKIKEEKKKYE